MSIGYVIVRVRDGAELQDDYTYKRNADPSVFDTGDAADDAYQLSDMPLVRCELRKYVDDPDPAKRTYTLISGKC